MPNVVLNIILFSIILLIVLTIYWRCLAIWYDKKITDDKDVIKSNAQKLKELLKLCDETNTKDAMFYDWVTSVVAEDEYDFIDPNPNIALFHSTDHVKDFRVSIPISFNTFYVLFQVTPDVFDIVDKSVDGSPFIQSPYIWVSYDTAQEITENAHQEFVDHPINADTEYLDMLVRREIYYGPMYDIVEYEDPKIRRPGREGMLPESKKVVKFKYHIDSEWYDDTKEFHCYGSKNLKYLHDNFEVLSKEKYSTHEEHYRRANLLFETDKDVKLFMIWYGWYIGTKHRDEELARAAQAAEREARKKAQFTKSNLGAQLTVIDSLKQTVTAHKEEADAALDKAIRDNQQIAQQVKENLEREGH